MRELDKPDSEAQQKIMAPCKIYISCETCSRDCEIEPWDTESRAWDDEWPEFSHGSTGSSISESETLSDSSIWNQSPLVNKVEDLIEMMRDQIDIRNRVVRLRKYKDCFVGSEAVDWMMEKLNLKNKEEAVAIGETLMMRGFIFHYTRSAPFKNSKTEFYRFSDKSESNYKLDEERINQFIDKMRWEVPIKDRRKGKQVYPACFVGAEAVDWFIKKLKLSTREEGVEFGQTLIDRSIIHHVKFRDTFSDKQTSYYQFYQDDKNFQTISKGSKALAAKFLNSTKEEQLDASNKKT